MPALAFGLAGPPSLPHVQFTTKDRCAPFRTASSTGLRRAGELIILSVNVRYGERRPAAQGRKPTIECWFPDQGKSRHFWELAMPLDVVALQQCDGALTVAPGNRASWCSQRAAPRRPTE